MKGKYNIKIRELWQINEDFKNEIPLQFPKIKSNPEILFVGINPSKRKDSPELKNYQDSSLMLSIKPLGRPSAFKDSINSLNISSLII